MAKINTAEPKKNLFEKIQTILASDYFVFSFMGFVVLAMFLFVQSGQPLK